MTATGKKTTAELQGYYMSGGTRALRDYYKDLPVLVVFPNGKENSLTWTPHSTGFQPIAKPATPQSGELDIEHLDIVPNLPDGSIVVPIDCNTRNNWTVNVGRADDAEIKFSMPSLSRYHARFHRNSVWYLEDLNSLNGTFIDGVQLLPGKQYQLQPYREIRFGPDVRVMFMDIRGLVDVCKVL